MRLIVAVAAVPVVVSVAWWLAHPGAPRVVEVAPEEVVLNTPVPAVAEDLADESVEMETLYDDEVTADETPTATQLRWLEEAVQAQREFVSLARIEDGAEIERLATLERKWTRARLRVALARADELERRALEEHGRGERVQASATLTEALRLLEEINRSPLASGFQRTGHEAVMRERLARWAAEEEEAK